MFDCSTDTKPGRSHGRHTYRFTRAGHHGDGHGGAPARRGIPLSIWNRTPGKAEPLAARGAGIAKSPREAVAGASVVISMLADVPVCRDIWLGRGEALEGCAPGTVLVESSTVTVEWIHELNQRAQQHGCDLVDAPVTGSKGQAARRVNYSSWRVGSTAALTKIDPVLRAMGPRGRPRRRAGQRRTAQADQ